MKRESFSVSIIMMFAVLFSLGTAINTAEAQTGSLTGVVRSGVTLIDGARITLTPGNYRATANLIGYFSFSDLPVGDYAIRVTASGYLTWNGNKTIASGVNLQDVEMTPLVETGSLSGVVRSGATLVNGATVSLSPGGYTTTTSTGAGCK